MKYLNILVFFTIIGIVFSQSIEEDTPGFHHKLKKQIKENIYQRLGHLIHNKRTGTSEGIYLDEINIVSDNEFKVNHTGLGDIIKQKVYKDLQSVFTLRSILRMKSGVGGITTITFNDGKSLIIKDNKLFECPRSISSTNGICSEAMKPFIPDDRKTYCYLRSVAETDEGICLSAKPVLFKCLNIEGKVLQLTKQEYVELCGDIIQDIKFVYYSDPNNRKHVAIPNSDPNIKCKNSEQGICEFTEKEVPDENSNVVINSVN